MKNLIKVFVALTLVYVINSCQKKPLSDDHEINYKIVYENHTEYGINMKVFLEKQLYAEYNLKPLSDSVFNTGTILGPVVVRPFKYLDKDGINARADSIYLEFSDNRYLTFVTGDSIFNIGAYEQTEFGDTLIVYKYYFTGNDYESAITIQ